MSCVHASDGVSIIICCYNSALRLPTTLRYIANQQASTKVKWEVIVVNNNSSDETTEVAQREWEKYSAPVTLTIIDEPNPGLSFAREAGLKQAKYDTIIFCDDDNWLDADYVQNAYKVMASDAQIGIVGGLNTAVADSSLPPWFKDFTDDYACGPQADQDGEVHPSRLYVTGAGMVIRKSVLQLLEKARFRSQLLDRKGEELTSGGDTEICFMAAILGYKIFYSSKLCLQHYMEAKRLEWNYLIKLKKGHAKSYYKLLYYKKLYQKAVYNKSWLVDFWQRSKVLFGKEGLIILYYYYIGGEKAIGDVFAISKIFYFETWKSHLKMAGSYSEFMDYLNTIKLWMSKRDSQN
ncbi:glycosyltransferase [Hymenobacter jejuensis]|uniref:Glycosyltransferase family 2 protein n=1 Tax=Hymenobacter jejuensis TaxID=2502781 RepID=A0A5B7ZX21_9BACT|nr:glycosyltransferase [Hymenobacter jejuensis]QDA59349.1 glycosyltransferase family 2 protein [Hymenobacter jejuensis]